MANSVPSREVACPVCQARPGENCTKADGTETKRRVHWQRVDAYLKAKEKPPTVK